MPWWLQEFLRLNKEAFEVYSEAKTAKDLRRDTRAPPRRWKHVLRNDLCVAVVVWLLCGYERRISNFLAMNFG